MQVIRVLAAASAFVAAGAVTPSPTHVPVPVPTPRPSRTPSALPSGTPVPSATPHPSGSPTPKPSQQPTPSPTEMPTPVPTPKPSPMPTNTVNPSHKPTPVPTFTPTPAPTTVADYFPVYHLNMLIRCVQVNNVNLQGPSNHTFNMFLRANIDEYETTVPVTFKGLGIVSADAKPVEFDRFDAAAGDLSCADFPEVGDPGFANNLELAFIHDFNLGSAEQLEFRSTSSRDSNGVANGDPMPTNRDFRPELSEVSALGGEKENRAVHRLTSFFFLSLSLARSLCSFLWAIPAQSIEGMLLSLFKSLAATAGASTSPCFFFSFLHPVGVHARQVCIRQTSFFRRDATGIGHDGVAVDIIVQEFDNTGSTTFVANQTLDMHNVFEPETRCVPVHPLIYKTRFGGFQNESFLAQDSLPWDMRIAAEFDAEISMLAFPHDDNTTSRADRKELTIRYGERLVALTETGAYPADTNEARDWMYQETERLIDEYSLRTVYDARYDGLGMGTPADHITRICDDACVARGGEYKGWQPHVVLEWNITNTRSNLKNPVLANLNRGSNPNSIWHLVDQSTYGQPLRLTDERRYFAASYDRTPPPVDIVKESIKFAYAYNETKCGNRKVGGSLNFGLDPLFVPYSNMLPDPLPECLSTSTEDTLSMDFTAYEEGRYYFYAHPAYDRQGLEANFSGYLGIPWPYSIKSTSLYTSVYVCGPTSQSTECDSTGSLPRTQNVTVPMDAEAFIFGYDFSFSQFAIYTFAEDDGFASENEGWALNHAPGLDAFQKEFGNLTYPLVSRGLYSDLMGLGVEEGAAKLVPNTATLNVFEGSLTGGKGPNTVTRGRTYRSNVYNETEWAMSRFVVTSSKDSRLDQVIELVADGTGDARGVEGLGYTTEFGKRCKVYFRLRDLANEFNYESHRARYYKFPLFKQSENDDKDDDLNRGDVENYLANTDSFGKFNYRKQPRENYEYNFTRSEYLETVFMPDSSDYSEAIASGDPAGNKASPIILNLNLTGAYSDDFFYMIGQHDSKKDGDQIVMARLRLMYSNDPLFQFVPVDSYTEVAIVNRHQENILPDSSKVMDDTGYMPLKALPLVNVTAKNNIDYTTDAGGLCTLLVSLTEAPNGIVKLAVSVTDKAQAQFYQGKSPLLVFSATNYQNLEVTLEGLNDMAQSTGDVPFDVAFSLVESDDPMYHNRYEAFNFAVSLTNLATTSDTRLAVDLNNTLCRTNENGGYCDVALTVCGHNTNGATGCEAPFNTYPIFTNGVTKVVVELAVSDRWESEITAVAGNGRFDASGSSIKCQRGRVDAVNGNADECAATVTFEPLAAGSGNSAQGPYTAMVRLTGVDDFVLDGPMPNFLSIASARVVRDRAADKDMTNADYVVYKQSVKVMNNDDDFSQVRLGTKRRGSPTAALGDGYPFAPRRWLEVTPARCETSEGSAKGKCPVTVTANFAALNNSVTTQWDDVTCAKLTFDVSWFYDNTTMPGDAVAAYRKSLDNVYLRAGPRLDEYGRAPKIYVYGDQGGPNLSPEFALDGARSGPDAIDADLDNSNFMFDPEQMVHMVDGFTADYCLPPGNNTGTFLNASKLYLPGASPGGGWVASITVTGTDTLLWTSLGLPHVPNPDQLGNFTFEVPRAGIPILLQGRPDAGPATGNGGATANVYINISSGLNGLTVSGMQNTSVSDLYTERVPVGDMFVEATFEETGSVSFFVDAADDDVDDDDDVYTIFVEARSVNLGFESEGESIITLNRRSQYTELRVTHYDDDTAGLLLEALDTAPFAAYRTDRAEPADVEGGGHRFFGMRHNQTSEGYDLDIYGDPIHANQTYFNVSLTSQPRAPVTVSVTASLVQSPWGWRVEGIPAGGSYVVKSYTSPSSWITGTNDTVVNPATGSLDLTFTPTNWASPQTVTVLGLDDFEDDGDREYTMTLTSASADLYYDSSDSASAAEYAGSGGLGEYSTMGYMPKVVVPLKNLDDDTAAFVAMQNGTVCAEPFFSQEYKAGVQMYLTSKPSSMVSVYLESSLPAEATPAQSLIAITPDNWETMKTVMVESVDDFAADGDQNFTVTVDLFYSQDAQYGNPQLFDRKFSFVSMDDPNDAMGVGAAVSMAVSSPKAWTSAQGASMDLAVSLTYKPQAPVYVSVTTSNLNQAVLTSASTLVFTPDNYAGTQTVTVMGVDDGLREGDTTYQIVLGLEATDDPYYERFAFAPNDQRDDKTVNFEVVNYDYPWARVRLAAMASGAATSEAYGAVNLTVGICEAIYAAVEEGGVAATQAPDLDATLLCGGYPLVSSELFGDLKFVTATVKLSDSSEAMLMCAPDAYSCDTSFDGSEATLVFDAMGYPDLSSFAPQLGVVGLDDTLRDGDVSYTVSVSAASVKYLKERHEVLDAYLPAPLVLTNVDDEPASAAEVNAWYTVDPARCGVFEGASSVSPSALANKTNCQLRFAFNDVVDSLPALNGPASSPMYLVHVVVMAGNSSVYLDGVNVGAGAVASSAYPLLGAGCVPGAVGCIEQAFFFPTNATFAFLPEVTVDLATVDDDWDDGDNTFTVATFGSIVFNCTDPANPTYASCETHHDAFGAADNVTYSVWGTEYDDDTAGLVFTQGGVAFAGNTALRRGRADGLEDDVTSSGAVGLPMNQTSESGLEAVSFEVRLSSAPSEDVEVLITGQQLDDEWGLGRFEGVPSLNTSKSGGGGYLVDSYVSPAPWVNATSTKDTVRNPATGRVRLVFTPADWNVAQTVYALGLDDLAADGDKAYNLYAQVTADPAERYRFDSGFDEATRLPLLNLDDEKNKVAWSATQFGSVVAEPFYGYSARIEVYPATEPADVILLSFSSTKPWIANTTETLVAISPSDWDQKKVVHVNAVDNMLDDGNEAFAVEMLMLGSSDQAYGAAVANQTFNFVKMDDPADVSFADAASGVAMEFAVGRNLLGVVQGFTTEYGGDGAILGDAEKSGSATLMVRLSHLPQDSVTYSLTVSDATEAQVLYPSTLAFTPENYNEYQEVVVIGRSDLLADGDVAYDVEFNLLGTNDPYYAALPLNRTSYTLINQDTVEQRLALGISSLGCYNVTEGTDFSRGFSVSGTAACVVTFTLCLSDTDTCTQPLTEQEVYNTSTSEALGISSIAVDAYLGDVSVARFSQPAHNKGQINVTSDGGTARVVLGLGRTLATSFNLTVYAFDDDLNDGKLATDLTVYGVLRKETSLGTEEVQEFVDYYDDFGNVDYAGTRNGLSVNMGRVPIFTRDDEVPDLRFFRVSSGCQTGEQGRVGTPGQAVSDGTCIVYARLGAQPAGIVEVRITSSIANAGMMYMGNADGTDSVDLACDDCPSSKTDDLTIGFDATNWNVPRKVVLVGQDDTEIGDKAYTLTATVNLDASNVFLNQAVTLSFTNVDDDSSNFVVSQGGSRLRTRKVGGRAPTRWTKWAP